MPACEYFQIGSKAGSAILTGICVIRENMVGQDLPGRMAHAGARYRGPGARGQVRYA